MSADQITSHDEQTSDPHVVARLMEACEQAGTVEPMVLRYQISHYGRDGVARFLATHGAIY